MKNNTVKKALILIGILTAMFTATLAVSAASPNMVVNGDFSNGLSSWTTHIQEGANGYIYETEYNDMRAHIWKQADLNWHIQAFQSGLFLEQGKTYTVSFDASTIGNKVLYGTVDVCIQRNGGDYTEYMPTQTVSVNPGTGTFSFSFTMLYATDTDGRITFNFGKNGTPEGSQYPAIIAIDNVNVNSGPNMIKNGEFKDGLTGWESYIHQGVNADLYVSGYYKSLRAYVNGGGTENWHVQVYQAGLTLEEGKTYELTFETTTLGEVSYGTLDVSIQENGDDYTDYMETTTINVNPGIQTIKLTFTMPEATDTDGRISFNFGLNDSSASGMATHIVVDNVSLIEK